MTNRVFIKIEGIQLGAEEEPVIQTAMGNYHFHNGRHYIFFDEKPEEGNDVIKNTIKIGLLQVEMKKSGAGSSQMAFDIDKETEAFYQTPYGNLCFKIKTSKLVASAVQERIRVKLEYSLYSQDSHLSDHETLITIEATETDNIDQEI